jgi:hypothetical protein
VAALIEWAMLRVGAPDTVAGEIHTDAVTRYLVPVRRPASRADRVRSGNGRTSATPAPISEVSPTRGRSPARTPIEPPTPSQTPGPAPAPSRSHAPPDPTDLAVEPDPLSPGSVEPEAPTPPHQEPAPLDRTELEDYLL